MFWIKERLLILIYVWFSLGIDAHTEIKLSIYHKKKKKKKVATTLNFSGYVQSMLKDLLFQCS